MPYSLHLDNTGSSSSQLQYQLVVHHVYDIEWYCSAQQRQFTSNSAI